MHARSATLLAGSWGLLHPFVIFHCWRLVQRRGVGAMEDDHLEEDEHPVPLETTTQQLAEPDGMLPAVPEGHESSHGGLVHGRALLRAVIRAARTLSGGG